MLRPWNGYTKDGRYSIPVGTFGAIRQWVCADCGPLDNEPKYRCITRQTNYEPEEWVCVCPECGDFDCVDDPKPRWSFKHTKRYTLRVGGKR